MHVPTGDFGDVHMECTEDFSVLLSLFIVSILSLKHISKNKDFKAETLHDDFNL